ncbi:MAG: hypothetical protein IT376_21580 [Polyangiaceae bacterium]|nr:hypothetical protein [Polyangiaceae bacterium]
MAGPLGGRGGADQHCRDALAGLSLPYSLPHVRAFLSVSETDEIRDLPANYGVPTELPVTSVDGGVVANDWADLLDGSIDRTLEGAHVLPAGATGNFWYSGSNADGSLSPNHCSGWTSTAVGDGRYGRQVHTGSQWIDTGAAMCGLVTYNVLCVGWQGVYLFDGGGTDTALGGRAGADALCAASTGSLPITQSRAFLSVSASDEIRDLPGNYSIPTDQRILGPNGSVIASDWADLLSGTLDRSLADAGVLTSNFWYSGSGPDGSLDAHTCTGWTTDGALFDGHYGVSGQTTSAWISTADATCGLAGYHVVCAGW